MQNDLKDRLAAAEQKKRAAQLQRQALADVDAEERAVIRAEQDAADEEHLLEIEQKHGVGNVASIRTDLGMVIVRRPSAASYRHYMDLPEEKRVRMQEVEMFAVQNLLYPSAEKFAKMLEDRPAILAEVAGAAYLLCSARAESDGKK